MMSLFVLAYGVYISQLKLYAHECSHYHYHDGATCTKVSNSVLKRKDGNRNYRLRIC